MIVTSHCTIFKPRPGSDLLHSSNVPIKVMARAVYRHRKGQTLRLILTDESIALLEEKKKAGEIDWYDHSPWCWVQSKTQTSENSNVYPSLKRSRKMPGDNEYADLVWNGVEWRLGEPYKK